MACSIFGVLCRDSTFEIEEHLREIIIRSEERGRTSFGLMALSGGQLLSAKSIGKPTESKIVQYGHPLPLGSTVAVGVNRAEPTNETVWDKTLEDVPPFDAGNWVLAHNGTIFSDRELVDRYQLHPRTTIDTAAVVEACNLLMPNGFDIAKLKYLLQHEVGGGFAFAFMHRNEPYKLILACNFKPLYLQFAHGEQAIYFASLPHHLQPDRDPLTTDPVQQVEPYSLVVVDYSGDTPTFEYHSLRAEKTTKRRALVVCSGGLDSVTVASYCQTVLGYDVDLLHFKYHCLAEDQEVLAVRNVAKALGCGVRFVETDLWENIGHSRLLQGGEEVSHVGDGIEGTERTTEYVPCRNTIMLTIAAGIAEVNGYDYVALGGNLEESGTYPDNEQSLIFKLNEVLPYALNLNSQVQFILPVGNLMKSEIVALAIDVNAPLQHTWSCYHTGEKHCGVCGPCRMRRVAFKMIGLVDPVFEHEIGEPFWKGCVPYLERNIAV